jgi:hypothetical protein
MGGCWLSVWLGLRVIASNCYYKLISRLYRLWWDIYSFERVKVAGKVICPIKIENDLAK